ncbi:hypothetical protein VFPPC_18031 [Pochonia chlamydosporia 170]|uniref:Uncharacterized protein n=1 Tax=Pochonia chlamydosporia 170 TaxID=1380566 RepID=A0A219APN4_METCM|nr:hypothetical protein VFPPC_18031 [Pochonia chlamydosporia 170]OWT42776.1 hypothetical protein VFPPC_18031 [Pochonia chlamydosporia 170]
MRRKEGGRNGQYSTGDGRQEMPSRFIFDKSLGSVQMCTSGMAALGQHAPSTVDGVKKRSTLFNQSDGIENRGWRNSTTVPVVNRNLCDGITTQLNYNASLHMNSLYDSSCRPMLHQDMMARILEKRHSSPSKPSRRPLKHMANKTALGGADVAAGERQGRPSLWARTYVPCDKHREALRKLQKAAGGLNRVLTSTSWTATADGGDLLPGSAEIWSVPRPGCAMNRRQGANYRECQAYFCAPRPETCADNPPDVEGWLTLDWRPEILAHRYLGLSNGFALIRVSTFYSMLFNVAICDAKGKSCSQSGSVRGWLMRLTVRRSEPAVISKSQFVSGPVTTSQVRAVQMAPRRPKALPSLADVFLMQDVLVMDIGNSVPLLFGADEQMHVRRDRWEKPSSIPSHQPNRRDRDP